MVYKNMICVTMSLKLQLQGLLQYKLQTQQRLATPFHTSHFLSQYHKHTLSHTSHVHAGSELKADCKKGSEMQHIYKQHFLLSQIYLVCYCMCEDEDKSSKQWRFWLHHTECIKHALMCIFKPQLTPLRNIIFIYTFLEIYCGFHWKYGI